MEVSKIRVGNMFNFQFCHHVVGPLISRISMELPSDYFEWPDCLLFIGLAKLAGTFSGYLNCTCDC